MGSNAAEISSMSGLATAHAGSASPFGKARLKLTCSERRCAYKKSPSDLDKSTATAPSSDEVLRRSVMKFSSLPASTA
eukprot:3415209-Prymnesium_polylepis.1